MQSENDNFNDKKFFFRHKWIIPTLFIILPLIFTIFTIVEGVSIANISFNIIISIILSLASYFLTVSIETNEKYKRFIETDIDKYLTDLKLGIREIINESIKDYLITSPSSIKEGFDETVRHLFELKSTELRDPISSFMHNSVAQIVENGFVNINADFGEYREKSNQIVECIYKSQNAHNSKIWMICQYDPLSYLILRLFGKDDTVDNENERPDHLLLFNGVIADKSSDIYNFANSCEKIRIAYLDKKFLKTISSDHQYIFCKTQINYIKSFAFAYFWFLFYNTEIKLFWRWKNCLAERDLNINGVRNIDDIDFMIFNEKYFWMYDIRKEILKICWEWSKLSKHWRLTLDEAIKLFRGADKHNSNKRGFYKSFYQLFKSESEFIAQTNYFSNALFDVVSKISSLNNGRNIPYMLINIAKKILEVYDNNNFEDIFNGIFNKLEPDEKIQIFRFLESESFVDFVSTNFNDEFEALKKCGVENYNYFVKEIRDK